MEKPLSLSWCSKELAGPMEVYSSTQAYEPSIDARPLLVRVSISLPLAPTGQESQENGDKQPITSCRVCS